MTRCGVPAGQISAPRWSWLAVVTLGLLIGLAVPILLGGCLSPTEGGRRPRPVAPMRPVDRERCEARGGAWTEIEGQGHCLARPPR